MSTASLRQPPRSAACNWDKTSQTTTNSSASLPSVSSHSPRAQKSSSYVTLRAKVRASLASPQAETSQSNALPRSGATSCDESSIASLQSVPDSLSSISSLACRTGIRHRTDSIFSRQSAKILLDSRAMQVLLFFLTIFALFGDSIRLAWFEKSADPTFDVITCVSLCLFTADIVLSSYGKSEYFMSFFFALDIISTASLILDLSFVWEHLVSENCSAIINLNVAERSEYARTSRSGRIGTRMARVIRIVRLLRITRIFKLYSMFKRHHASDGLTSPGQDTDNVRDTESRVGRKLSDRTTLWVIVLVLTLLVCLPLLDPGSYSDSMVLSSSQYGVDVVEQAWQEYQMEGTRSQGLLSRWWTELLLYVLFHRSADFLHTICFIGRLRGKINNDTNDSTLEWMNSTLFFDIPAMSQHSASLDDSVLVEHLKSQLASPWRTVCGQSKGFLRGISLLHDYTCPMNSFRLQDTTCYAPQIPSRVDPKDRLVAFFDIRRRNKLDAGFSILQTLFIMTVLIFSAFSFSKDADRMVLQPIERMIKMVEQIRRDPLCALNLVREEQRGRTRMRNAKERRKAFGKRWVSAETKVLENTIIKLGYLLALGFGEAGVEMIGQNLDDLHMSVDAMVPGSKVEAIFGYCRISNLADALEVLQERVLIFINRVSAIVHSIVTEHLGAPSLNDGEGFLLVWRLQKFTADLRPEIADLSVQSLAVMVAGICSDADLLAHREHPGMVSRLGADWVGVTFGLHLGYAIEGAIGSEYKVDASYLSSDVCMATGAEDLTRHYGAIIIITESVVRACSKDIAQHLRAIDFVKLPTAKHPLRLFSLDLDCSSSVRNNSKHDAGGIGLRTKPVVERRGSYSRRRTSTTSIGSVASIQSSMVEFAKSALKNEKLQKGAPSDASGPTKSRVSMFRMHRRIKSMRFPYTLEFYQEFEKGYVNYEAGEWSVAADIFLKTRSMLYRSTKQYDGPSIALLTYMNNFASGDAPSDWRGWRHSDSCTLESRRRLSFFSKSESGLRSMEVLPISDSINQTKPNQTKPRQFPCLLGSWNNFDGVVLNEKDELFNEKDEI